jgi:hypothetical protein
MVFGISVCVGWTWSGVGVLDFGRRGSGKQKIEIVLVLIEGVSAICSQ